MRQRERIGNFERLTMVRLAGLGHDQDRLHAALMRHDQVALDVFEHRRRPRVDAMLVEKALIGAQFRLGDELRIHDIENFVETRAEPQRLGGQPGVIARAIGQDQLAAGQSGDRRRQRQVGRQRGSVDVMHIGEEFGGADA